MLKKILIALFAIAAGFAAIVAVQPAEYRVSRSGAVDAAPASVFLLINDFHNWESWSPWARLDPAMKTSFEGAPAGVGAAYTWSGNSDVGAGRMTITGSDPLQSVRINLDFLEPFASSSVTEFTLKPAGNGVALDWTMTGRNGFIEKAFCLFVDMDKMIGADFEKGIAQLKSVAESRKTSAN